MNALVRVQGADEVARAFRRASPELAKSLQVAHKSIAQAIVPEIQQAVRSLPSPGGTRAVKGITARGSRKGAAVAFSKARSRQPLMASVLGADTHPVFGRRMPVTRMKRRLWQPHMGNGWTPDRLYGAGPVFERFQRTFQRDAYEKAILESLRRSFS